MTTPPAPAVGELLRQHRLAAGLTQDGLAERARISVRAISDLERGVRRAPHKDTLRLLAAALQLSADAEALLLAAARIKLLAPQALLARLDGRLSLLTNGAADLPERQQTMPRALEWSYDLLTPSEQRLFRYLAVFVDGWTLEAVEAICAESSAQAEDVC